MCPEKSGVDPIRVDGATQVVPVDLVDEKSSQPETKQLGTEAKPNVPAAGLSASLKKNPEIGKTVVVKKKVVDEGEETTDTTIEFKAKAEDIFPSYLRDCVELAPSDFQSYTVLAKTLKGIENDHVLSSVYIGFPFVQRIVQYEKAMEERCNYERAIAAEKQKKEEQKRKSSDAN